jgi:hypothetical protein
MATFLIILHLWTQGDCKYLSYEETQCSSEQQLACIL